MGTAGLLTGGGEEEIRPNPEGYKDFRFEYETRDPSCTIVHLAELTLHRGGDKLKPEAVLNAGGGCPDGEGAENVHDGNRDTKWLDLKKKPLRVSFSDRVVADSFSFVTAGDGPERDPTSFRLYGWPGRGSSGWDLLVNRRNVPVTETRREEVGPFKFMDPETDGTKWIESVEDTKKKKNDVRSWLTERPNFYALLSIPVDFVFEDHLKRQFRKFSRAAHPDKNGGSSEVFQEIGRAVESLEDARARIQYDAGFDLDSAETQAQGYQADEPLKMKVEREYFPERFGYFAFVDPYDYKKHLTGAGGNRRHGNVYNELWDKPLPAARSQSTPEMIINEERSEL